MRTITAIILAHYKERENNLKRIIDDLLNGLVKPKEIVVFIDNPKIEFEDKRATIIRSSKSFLPKIRFALGCYFDTDFCFFIENTLLAVFSIIERKKHGLCVLLNTFKRFSKLFHSGIKKFFIITCIGRSIWNSNLRVYLP